MRPVYHARFLFETGDVGAVILLLWPNTVAMAAGVVDVSHLLLILYFQSSLADIICLYASYGPPPLFIGRDREDALHYLPEPEGRIYSNGIRWGMYGCLFSALVISSILLLIISFWVVDVPETGFSPSLLSKEYCHTCVSLHYWCNGHYLERTISSNYWLTFFLLPPLVL